MSLKAKLEAVIYAAEEPVTLNQLAALFAADALEWKAQQEVAAAEQTAEMAGVSPAVAGRLPLVDEGLEYLGLTDSPAVYAGGDAPAAPPEAAVEGNSAEVSAETSPAPAEAEGAPPSSEAVVSVGQEQAYPAIVVDERTGAEAPAAAETANGGEGSAGPDSTAASETDAKRAARQRDREVKAILKQLLDELMASCSADGRGVEIREIAGGYRMATKPECHDAVRLFVKSLKPPLKLSLPALETLAVVAYKQPVTAPEVNEIRGVESAGVLGSLLARKLIATAGRKQVIGRPILYKTTKEFLLRFGLKDVSELPSMDEFEKMEASELEIEAEAAQPDQPAVTNETSPDETTPEGNGQPEVESNPPNGEEMAGTAEATEIPAAEIKPDSAGSDSQPKAEIEAHPDAQEIEENAGRDA